MTKELKAWQLQTPKFTLTMEKLAKASDGQTLFFGCGLIQHPYATPITECMPANIHSDKESVLVSFVVIKRATPLGWCIYHSLTTAFEPTEKLGGTEHLSTSASSIRSRGSQLGTEETLKIIKCEPRSLINNYEL